MRKGSAAAKTAGFLVPIIPSPGEEKDDADYGVTIRLPQSQWDALDEIIENETVLWAKAGKPRRWTRNAVVAYMVKWGIEQYWAEKGGKPANKKR